MSSVCIANQNKNGDKHRALSVRYQKAKSKRFCQFTVYGEEHIDRFLSYKQDTHHLHEGKGRVFWQYRSRRNKRTNKKTRYHHNQPLGKNWFYTYPRTIAKALKLPNPEKYSGHTICGTGATIVADKGATIVQLQRYGNWESSKVAMGYVRNSKKFQHQNASTFANLDGSSSNHNNPRKRKSCDKQESDDVDDDNENDENEPQLKKQRISEKMKETFNNCTFNNCTFKL